MKVILMDSEYEIIKNYKDAFNLEDLEHRFEDYFEKYDYIFGDYAYGKLRLKGFFSGDHKDVAEINNYDLLDQYIKEFCAFDCKHYVIKKK